MAGCFGNHPVDRMLEGQLMRYLDDCSDYESLCEKISAKIPDDIWDEYSDVLDRIIDTYLALRVERLLMTMEEAQNMILKLALRIDANKIYEEGR